MATGIERMKAEAEFDVGFCAPLINVNGFSCVDFVRGLGLKEEYEGRFGAARRACGDIPAHNHGEAAVWLWQHGLLVDRMVEQSAAQRRLVDRDSIDDVVFER